MGENAQNRGRKRPNGSDLNSFSPVCDLLASAGWPVVVHDHQARIVLVSDLTGVPLHRFAKYAYESTSHAVSGSDVDCFHIFLMARIWVAARSFVVLSQTVFFHGALWHGYVVGNAVEDSALPRCTSKFVVRLSGHSSRCAVGIKERLVFWGSSCLQWPALCKPTPNLRGIT